MSDKKSPVLFLPHGGGPLPLLGDPGHKQMVDFLTRIRPTLGRPSAILVISAHWEERRPTITSGAFPPLIYDYSGFPEESYEIQYPAPGNPTLAREAARMLKESGFDPQLDDRRGFDHGLFVPLKLLFPQAEYPCIQISLVRDLDAATHIRLGNALSGLRKQDVLIIGSGFSFHNLRAFFTLEGDVQDPRNDAFQQWLVDLCTTKDTTQEEREKGLIAWESAPNARYCHPREEHLLPLHVCCGIAGSPAQLVFDGEILGKKAIGLLW